MKQGTFVSARNPAAIKPITAQVADGAETEEDGLEAAGQKSMGESADVSRGTMAMIRAEE